MRSRHLSGTAWSTSPRVRQEKSQETESKLDALMMRVKAGKVPWMSTVLRYNCLEEVTALGVEPRVPRKRAPPDKEKNREYANNSYYKQHDKNKKKHCEKTAKRVAAEASDARRVEVWLVSYQVGERGLKKISGSLVVLYQFGGRLCSINSRA